MLGYHQPATLTLSWLNTLIPPRQMAPIEMIHVMMDRVMNNQDGKPQITPAYNKREKSISNKPAVTGEQEQRIARA